ncbi:DNA repair protein RecN [Zavarzinia compransoris]|uniref:DNA repair protein RecN n=1 Tax=Zavarzinia compransoris TaxID=1264899 RepID=A0A317DYV5_9PROT|nr:DNA repair protein RecN [Zavarzinia compransoris]PWR18055.1 DNA repair protein RecN [Zavarzinia compransoris]TDP43473.1 DNA replication and repair protein RecN [Zavarzinia compransoris]
MLLRLAIRDVVLIERLDLDFAAGLTVLTGETGAGKSILLDSLGLALGARADSGLVRPGADQAVITAEFALAPDHAVAALLRDQGWRPEDTLVLRRVVTRDGRSRAFVDDQSASVGLLGQIGALLIEAHGQHDDRGLLNPAGHRDLLDAFAGHGDLLAAVRAAHGAHGKAAADLGQAEAGLAAARRDEEYLRHVVGELRHLAPEPGEEQRLAAERHTMQEGERAAGDLDEVAAMLDEYGGVEARLRGAQRRLERAAGRLGPLLEPALNALDRAALEAEEAVTALAAARSAIAYDERRLEIVEERLFALRAAARKHQVQPDALPGLAATLEARIAALDAGEGKVTALAAVLDGARRALQAACARLHEARVAAALRLDQGVNGELEALRLGKARFRTRIEPLGDGQWTADGADRVTFEVSTNPGAPFGALIKIASGGELARFILALKVVLAGAGTAPTMVFDEVDRGIGGAVADAVGDRLARLAERAQVLVVTHSPQVAARGRNHFRIAKDSDGETTRTQVTTLDPKARREEIARMLSGAEITTAARAAADALLKAAR